MACFPSSMGFRLCHALLLGLLFLCMACGERRQQASSEGPAGSFTRADSIHLEEEVAIGEASGTFLGRIAGIAVDARGRIYAADRDYQTIRVFSPSGDSLKTIGREGEGPGEFTRLRGVQIGAGDSLFAYDGDQRRISAFGSSGRFAYSTTVSSGGRGLPSRLIKPDTTGFVIEYSVPYTSRSQKVEHSQWIRWLSPDGRVLRDSLLVAPNDEAIIEREEGRSITIASLPFGRSAVIRVGPGNTLFYGWNDSLSIGWYTLEGQRLGRVQLPYEPVPVTDADVEAILERYPDNELGSRLKKMVRDADLPETRPAFQDFVVGDQGRLWIEMAGRPREERGDRSSQKAPHTWRVVDRERQTEAPLTLPQRESIEVVRQGKVYVLRQLEAGLQEIVVYRLKGSGASGPLRRAPR